MTQEGKRGGTRHRSVLETFAGTGIAPTDDTRTHRRRTGRSGRTALIDADVPSERMTTQGGSGTIERASLAITDVALDAEEGPLARGLFRARGSGPNDATWLCNRPFENVPLSLSLAGPRGRAGSISLGPIDLGDHGVVTLANVFADVPECDGGNEGDSPTSLLGAVARLSESATTEKS